MLNKCPAWTHLSNFDQLEHKTWTYGVTNAWPHGLKSQKQLPSLPVKSGWILASKVSLKSKFNRSSEAHKHYLFLCILKKLNLKLVTCQRIASKAYSTSIGRYLSPRYGQIILVSGYPFLRAVNWSQHGCAISGCTWAPKLLPIARKCEMKHWLRCGADGRSVARAVYCHMITKFSRMDRFT